MSTTVLDRSKEGEERARGLFIVHTKALHFINQGNCYRFFDVSLRWISAPDRSTRNKGIRKEMWIDRWNSGCTSRRRWTNCVAVNYASGWLRASLSCTNELGPTWDRLKAFHRRLYYNLVDRFPYMGREGMFRPFYFPFIPFLSSLIHLPQPTSLFLSSPLIRAMRVSMSRFLL